MFADASLGCLFADGVFYCALRVLVCCRIACDCDCLVGGVAVFRECYGGLRLALFLC